MGFHEKFRYVAATQVDTCQGKQRMREFGSIRKLPSGRWQASYRNDGIHHSGGTFRTKDDAANWLSVTETDISRGEWCDPRLGRMTLEKYSGEWLKSKNLAVKTAELYSWLLDSWITPDLGSLKMADITPLRVRSWHASIEKPNTAAKAYRLLSQIMKTAVDDQVIHRSPCRIKGAGQEHAPERPMASVEEIQLLADAISPRLRLFVLLAAWCQLRRGELLGLKRADVDPLHGVLTVRETRVVTMKGKVITKAPKTRAGSRTVSIPSFLTAEVDFHLKKYSGDFVFTGAEGGPLPIGTLNRNWRQARLKVNRPDLTLHDLRHTGLTLAAVSGATIAELMRRAGHSSPSAAIRYQHATVDRDKVLAEALGRLAATPTLEMTENDLTSEKQSP